MKRSITKPASVTHPVLAKPDTEPVLFDIHQLAKALNVGRTTIENWTRSRRIPSMKLGRVLRYDLNRVMAALEAYERKAV
jgi:excisionase family DNA binding protein